MNIPESSFITALLFGAVRSGTPFLLAGLGELVAQKSGVLNLGLEGIMLAGALSAVWVYSGSGSILLSMAVAAVFGGLLGISHGYLCVRMRVNQVAAGLAMVIAGTGATAILGRNLVGRRIDVDLPVGIAFFRSLPIVGRGLFGHDFMVYASLLAAAGIWWFLACTRGGLRLRAAGESAESARSCGINVAITRLYASAFCGCMCGIGGGYLSLVYAGQWQENMVSGRGWIALVLVISSMWRPFVLVGAAYLFGGLTALQLNLQAIGVHISQYFLGMVPFVITIAALVVAALIYRRRPNSMPVELTKGSD